MNQFINFRPCGCSGGRWEATEVALGEGQKSDADAVREPCRGPAASELRGWRAMESTRDRTPAGWRKAPAPLHLLWRASEISSKQRKLLWKDT